MGRLASMSARLRALPPARVLAGVAALLGVANVVEAATVQDVGARGVAVAFAAVLAVPLAYAWRSPLGALLTFEGLALVQGALGGRLFGETSTSALMIIAYVFVLALRADTRTFALGAGATIVAMSILAALEHDEPSVLTAAAWIALVPVALPSAAGRVLRSRNDLNRRLHEQAREIEHNRHEREHAAVLAERTRIARELHDIVAHDVSVMLVQAQAARRTVHADPVRARGAIAAVEETGREALGELRRLLGVLRRGDEDLALAPQPTLARVSTLVERIATTGLAVELEVDGAQRPLPPGVDAAAYRIVLEALTNVAQHARARHASVRVTYDARAVQLVVSDDGTAVGPLREGVVALRERVALYGGELRAGRRRGVGFELQARLPIPEGA